MIRSEIGGMTFTRSLLDIRASIKSSLRQYLIIIM